MLWILNLPSALHYQWTDESETTGLSLWEERKWWSHIANQMDIDNFALGVRSSAGNKRVRHCISADFDIYIRHLDEVGAMAIMSDRIGQVLL